MRQKSKDAVTPELAHKILREQKLQRLRKKRFQSVGYILGEETAKPEGFGLSHPRRIKRKRKSAKLKRHKGEYHAVVLAGTGQGKGVSVLIPQGLMHDGQFICVDPKGEMTNVVARRRREMGDRVIIIDPFCKLGAASHSLNPLDLLKLKCMGSDCLEDLSETIAAELGATHEIQKDMFWWNTATSLIGGLIAYAGSHPDPAKRNLNTVVELLSKDDVVYGLAVLLDTEGKKMNEFAYKRISEFLQTPDGNNGSTRGCVLVSALQMIHCLQARRISRILGTTSFDLNNLLHGEAPLSIFIVFPPEKVKSHRGLLRILLATLMQVLWNRKSLPSRRTLVCLDEAANIGKLDLLPTMHSYGRGLGVSVLTAWQSLGQLSDLYPTEWRVIVENALIQTFGLHPTAVDPVANFLGVPASLIRGLPADKQVVALPVGLPFVMGKIDYRTHPMLNVMADVNPVYVRQTP